MPIDIVTPRLILRPARAEDLDGLHALVSDFEVVKMTSSWPWPPDRAFTASRSKPFDPAKGFVGPVFLGGEIIGMAGVTEAELGYMFARAHWGRGYAPEICAALVTEAFARYDWPEIRAGVLEDNPASTRVLEKLGFAEISPGEGPVAARGRTLPLRRFRLPRP